MHACMAHPLKTSLACMHLHVPCESWSLLYLSLSYSNLASVVCVCVVGSRLIQARFCVYTENCSLIGFVRAEQVMFGAHMLCFYYYQTIPNFLCRSSRSTLFEPCLFMIVNHEFLQNLSIRFSHRSVQFTNGYCVCWKEESGVLKIILWDSRMFKSQHYSVEARRISHLQKK